MSRIQIVLSAAVLLILGAAAVWQSKVSTTVVPPASQLSVSTSTESSSAIVTEPPALDIKAVSVTPIKRQPQTSFSLADGESIASWDFKGAYTDNPELVAKAQSEIQRLSEQLKTATSSAMILSVGIANQYELLGDGKNQYDYLTRAIQANPENGLPWHNLGVLMERLGAPQTARVAFEKSTLIQPELAVYHYSYLEFLIQNMKNDTVGIEKAFRAAEENIGPKQYLAELRSQWQNP